ncbi:MAG TPA: dynamin family protein, partial [Candidatus Acidoferrum sp.]|nr:dynamin family protein [Candidatus Acidoferrum sp.]
VNELKLGTLEPQVNACRNQLLAGQGVEVAVFGRFKAGKSSFLNHLAGREVLPVGVVPLTAVITRLRFGPVERAEVRFQNGEARPIALSEIVHFVAERDNPDNQKHVAAVEVELPQLRELAPLAFVDTPGLGSALVHNTQAALQWLPNAGAALVAVSADAPLSERDVALIEQLRPHTPSIVLLLTKADLLTEEQRAEVMHFVRQESRRQWQAELPLFFYSIRPGFERLRHELMQRLLLPLVKGHAEAGTGILRHKLLSLASQLSDYLRVGLAAAEQEETARRALADGLRAERRDGELLRAEFSGLGRQWSAAALETSLARLQPLQAELVARALAELAQRGPEWQPPLPALLAAWRAWLRSFLLRELGDISRSNREMFCEPLSLAERHLARMLQAFQDRLSVHVQAALGVTLSRGAVSLKVPQPAAPPVDVGYAFDEAFTLAGRFLPMAVLRRPVLRALRRKTRWEVEKNLSRLASAWQQRVSLSIGELVLQAETQAAAELAALEQMVVQAQASGPRLRESQSQVVGIQEQLQSPP